MMDLEQDAFDHRPPFDDGPWLDDVIVWIGKALLGLVAAGVVFGAGIFACRLHMSEKLGAIEHAAPVFAASLSVSERAAFETEAVRTMLREVPTCSPPARMVRASATEDGGKLK
jgi:hypothetical protein